MPKTQENICPVPLDYCNDFNDGRNRVFKRGNSMLNIIKKVKTSIKEGSERLEYSFSHRKILKPIPRVMIEITGAVIAFTMVAILLILFAIFPFMVLKNIITGKKIIKRT